MSAGQRPLEDAPVNLQLLTKRIVDANRERAGRNRIDIDIHDRLAGYGLIADECLLQQLMENLISNAIKFNRAEGRVDIYLRRDCQNRIVLEIKDTGIGIPQDEQANALKPFVQLSPGYDRQYEGIGLGLTLAENQATAHGADLKIISGEQPGTTVELVFPDYRTLQPVVCGSNRSQAEPIGDSSGKAA